MDVKDFYNKISSKYEELIASPKTDAKLHENLLNILIKHSIDSGSILDVGCGPGNLKNYLGDNFTYTGIDISDEMLNIAKQKEYRTIEGSLDEIIPELKSNSFDYVVAISSLHFIENIETVLKEFERIARKGYFITLERVTDNYKKGFSSVCEGPIYNHFELDIVNTTEEIKFPGWFSSRDNEFINARMIFKKTN
jgi:ubiquinone/menaquinone biosynthesis C-methylase UbiE